MRPHTVSGSWVNVFIDRSFVIAACPLSMSGIHSQCEVLITTSGVMDTIKAGRKGPWTLDTEQIETEECK